MMLPSLLFPRARGLTLLLVTTLSACANDASLIVDVHTDLAAGVEFDALTIAEEGVLLSTRASTEDERGRRFLETPLRIETSIAEGRHRLRVALERGGEVVLSARISLEVVGRTGVSVLLTSACLDVVCGDDAPNCLNTQCVPAGCLTGNESACDDAERCGVDTDCPASAVACLLPVCLEGGVCATVEGSGAELVCATDEYCDRSAGCTPLLPPADGGVGDGGSGDAGSGDAGSGDAGSGDAGDDCERALGRSCAEFEEAYLKASNTGAGDRFGYSVALEGDSLAVGVYYERSGAAGVGGDQSSNTLTGAGAVYVFVRSGGTWKQQAYLKASNPDADDRFGTALSLSGETLAVGARREQSAATGVDGDQTSDAAAGAGAVYVFVRAGTTWSQEAYVKASNTDAGDIFGSAVALSGDLLAVGARNEDSLAWGVNGVQDDNSSPSSGAVYVFTRSGTSWAQEAYLKAAAPGAGDQFGYALALADDTLAVGAPFEDSSATGVNGDTNGAGASYSGAVYVFTRGATGWSQEAYLKASNTDANDNFGGALALDGDTLAVGASGEASASSGVDGDGSDNSVGGAGAVYVFVRADTLWSQEAYLKASNPEGEDRFGHALALHADALAVGAPNEAGAGLGLTGDAADNGADDAGAVYLFTRAGAIWTQRAYIKASNTGVNDQFGDALALWGDTLAIAASLEASGATGIDGDQADDGSVGAGAVYVRRFAP